jgi:hypothetical protein
VVAEQALAERSLEPEATTAPTSSLLTLLVEAANPSCELWHFRPSSVAEVDCRYANAIAHFVNRRRIQPGTAGNHASLVPSHEPNAAQRHHIRIATQPRK